MGKCRNVRHRVFVFVYNGLSFSGNHILTNDEGSKGVEAGRRPGGFDGVKLGAPLEAALEVGKGGGGQGVGQENESKASANAISRSDQRIWLDGLDASWRRPAETPIARISALVSRTSAQINQS